MNEILTKISSYNIFNYLFPGAIFTILADKLGILKAPEADIATMLLLYYFIGMSVSRIGSVLIEPALKRTGFVKYSRYSDYIIACGKDPKLEVFVEVSNTYRTLASSFMLLPITFAIRTIADSIELPSVWRYVLLAIFLLVLFLFSFRKQTAYILQRVRHHSMSP